MSRLLLLFVCSVFLSVPPMCATAAENAQASSLADAVAGSTVGLSFRYRLESVDDAAVANNGLASTLRTRLQLLSQSYRGFKIQLEVDDVTYLGNDNFNNTRNGVTDHAAIADPDGTGINQANLQFGDGPTRFTLGRQRINLDNQRFVGGVGWRQNEQTYDAFSAVYSDHGLRGQYTFVEGVSRVFGPSAGAPAASIDADSHLLNVAYDLGEGKQRSGSVTGYGYFLDHPDVPGSSTRTLGVRLSAALALQDFELPLALEVAQQKPFADNTGDFSLGYRLAEVGVKRNSLAVTLGQEVLEGNGTLGFSTPLATLHKFQGWADKFLATPPNGIKDTYLSLGVGIAGARLVVARHQFRAENSAADYGNETDLSISKKVGQKVELLLKFADFRSRGFAGDTTKAWLMVSASL